MHYYNKQRWRTTMRTSHMFSLFVYNQVKRQNFLNLLVVRLKDESQMSNSCKILWKNLCSYRKRNTRCALPATPKYTNIPVNLYFFKKSTHLFSSHARFIKSSYTIYHVYWEKNVNISLKTIDMNWKVNHRYI